MNIPDRIAYCAIAGTLAGLGGLFFGWAAGSVAKVDAIQIAREEERNRLLQFQEQAVGLGYARWRSESAWSGDTGFVWITPKPRTEP